MTTEETIEKKADAFLLRMVEKRLNDFDEDLVKFLEENRSHEKVDGGETKK